MRRIAGRRVVVAIYLAMVALAGLLGFVLGSVVLPSRLDGGLPSAELGPLVFPITPLTFAIYGVVMVGTTLGIGLFLVAYVSERRA